MATILHLSDLHLGSRDRIRDFYDYKTRVIPKADRTTHMTLLESTLREVARHLKKEGEDLAAILITGDITIAGDEDGFKELPKLLEALGDKKPEASKIVVTPGNHDVRWGTKPGAEERYELFIRHIREKGYITPMLDGVDLNDGVNPPKLENHYLLATDNSWMVIPLNSCNYSGVLESVEPFSEQAWAALAIGANGVSEQDAKRVLTGLRTHDLARFSARQLDAAAHLVDEVSGRLGQAPSLRIAAIHHHLLPVSQAEEVKTFESVTNLNQFRSFMRSHQINILLHGHKHAGATYWDHIDDVTEFRPSTHRVLVVSGSTIGAPDGRRDEVCRLLNVHADRYVPSVAITSIPAVDSGSKLPKLDSRKYFMFEPSPLTDLKSPEVKVISGHSFDEVYVRLQVLLGGSPPNATAYNLMCQISDPSTAVELPHTYPEITGVGISDRQKWYKDLIDWWQLKESALIGRMQFTHGSRIRAYGANKFDQLEEAVRSLKSKSDSSRAVIGLLFPEEDLATDREKKFPAFCFVQFSIRTSRDDRMFLDCFGFYRKQEMKYWWPINVGELFVLQRELFERLKVKQPGLSLGTITTFATLARLGVSQPKVIVPLVDRMVDGPKEVLDGMAYAIFWKDMPGRSAFMSRWNDVLDDLVPASALEEDGGGHLGPRGFTAKVDAIGPSPFRGDRKIRPALDNEKCNETEQSKGPDNGIHPEMVTYDQGLDQTLMLRPVCLQIGSSEFLAGLRSLQFSFMLEHQLRLIRVSASKGGALILRGRRVRGRWRLWLRVVAHESQGDLLTQGRRVDTLCSAAEKFTALLWGHGVLRDKSDALDILILMISIWYSQ